MDAGRYSSYTQKETFCADVEKTAARFAQISDPAGAGNGLWSCRFSALHDRPS